jgi:hypothetical protein
MPSKGSFQAGAARHLRMAQFKWLPNGDAIRHVRFIGQSQWLRFIRSWRSQTYAAGSPDCGWRGDIVEKRRSKPLPKLFFVTSFQLRHGIFAALASDYSNFL